MERAASAAGVAVAVVGGAISATWSARLVGWLKRIFIPVANAVKWMGVRGVRQDAAQPIGDGLALLDAARSPGRPILNLTR